MQIRFDIASSNRREVFGDNFSQFGINCHFWWDLSALCQIHQQIRFSNDRILKAPFIRSRPLLLIVLLWHQEIVHRWTRDSYPVSYLSTQLLSVKQRDMAAMCLVLGNHSENHKKKILIALLFGFIPNTSAQTHTYLVTLGDNWQYLVVTLGTKLSDTRGSEVDRYYEPHHKKHVPHSSQLNGEGGGKVSMLRVP